MMNNNRNTKIILFSLSAFFELLGIIILCSGGIGFGIFIMIFAFIPFGIGLKNHFSETKVNAQIKILNESFNRSLEGFKNKISYTNVEKARKDVFEYISILSEEEYKKKWNLLPYSEMCIATTTTDLDNLTFAILYYHYADFFSMIKELKETFKINGNINWEKLKRSIFYFLTKDHDVNSLDIKDEKNLQFVKSICDIIESSIERIEYIPKTHSVAPAPTISKTEELILARELLVSYYLDLIDESQEQDKLTQEELDLCKSKRPLIQDSIREYIMDKEEKYGSGFLTENPKDNSKQNHIFTLISKYAFCVSLYYSLGFDSYPLYSKKEVCFAIQEVLDESSSAILTNDEFKLAILKHLN